MATAKRQAALALRVITDDSSGDQSLAAEFGSQRAAAEAMSALAGFLLQALAVHRGEDVADTATFIRHWIGREPDDGLTGVRPPH
jgi:hypothetical protein